jgi:uncharacterized protein
MRQYERGGVTIDQCGECRGIFLDRGELEHLVDAETRWSGPSHDQQYGQQYGHNPRHHDDDDDYRHHGDYRHPRKKKKKSFFEELFDD